MEETKDKEEKQENPTQEEISEALAPIPDLEAEDEEVEEAPEVPVFEEGVDKVSDIEEGQESDYGF